MRTAPTAERAGDRDDEDDGAGEEPASTDGSPAPPGRLGVKLPSWVGDAALVGIVVVGVVFRFVVRSNLWLDEALSVNIASLGLGDLLEALRHDGHPPLYYMLLHYWMQVAGEGDAAVRVLSGIFAVASLPLVWVGGRRLAGTTGARWTLVLVALSPYWIRYATEARMYSLVMFLVLAGYLLLGDTLRRPTPLRLLGLAVLSGMLLLSHYWAFWLLGGIGLVLLWRWWRRPAERGTTTKVLVSIGAGGVLFLPWVPSFLYQAQHTGTPWANPMRPLALVHATLADLGGGARLNESFIYGMGIVILGLLGLFVARSKGAELILDLRTVPAVRSELTVVALTAGIGCVMAYVASATYQSRYAAVFVPLVYLAAGVGLARLPAVGRVAAGGFLAALSLVGIGWNLYYHRTQSAPVASEVAARSEAGDVVVYCPDQLGPAFSRAMPDGLVERTYPSLDSPERVDWVDYADRNAAADPQAVAEEVRELAQGSDIFVVWMGEYETLSDQCEALVHQLGVDRSVETLVSQDAARHYEPANLVLVGDGA